ncbi:hypothetical protein FACS1894125_2140 [Actinomycetota bacterium]|nr:hypothetical protein FACS1894125_2140 [Actinomycetota bacterium]
MWDIFDETSAQTREPRVRTRSKSAGFKSSVGHAAEYDDDVIKMFETASNEYSRTTPWQFDAVCATTAPEAFFPERGGSAKEARAICSMCPVRVDCLDYAIENGISQGIWGGTSERERRQIQLKVKFKDFRETGT